MMDTNKRNKLIHLKNIIAEMEASTISRVVTDPDTGRQTIIKIPRSQATEEELKRNMEETQLEVNGLQEDQVVEQVEDIALDPEDLKGFRDQMEELAPISELPPEPEEDNDEGVPNKMSSTDYFYQYLKDAGVVSNKGEIITAQAVVNNAVMKNTPKTMQASQQEEYERFTPGVYNLGFVMIAPRSEDTPIQTLKGDESQMNKGAQ